MLVIFNPEPAIQRIRCPDQLAFQFSERATRRRNPRAQFWAERHPSTFVFVVEIARGDQNRARSQGQRECCLHRKWEPLSPKRAKLYRVRCPGAASARCAYRGEIS